MARQLYATEFVQLAGSASPAPNLPFRVYTDLTAGSDVTSQIVGPDGSSVYAAVTDSQGNIAPFRGPDGYLGNLFVDTGGAYRFMLKSPSLLDYFASSISDLAAAQAASAAGGGSGTPDWTAITNKPTTFTPSTHTHPSGQISDSTPTGRAVIAAADAQAARVAIGAGTGNGTSNLALGTTATSAAAGNHSHTASSLTFAPSGSITATDVQTAIVQAAQSGGGTGTSSVYVWRYSAGGWPTLPTTKPTGVLEVRALGPSYPTSIPTWVGLSAAQIPMSYSLVNVA